MNTRTVETMEKWVTLKVALIENGFKLFQMQYSAKQDEGFHVWFFKDAKQKVEVITHNVEIEQDIIKNNLV